MLPGVTTSTITPPYLCGQLFEELAVRRNLSERLAKGSIKFSLSMDGT